MEKHKISFENWKDKNSISLSIESYFYDGKIHSESELYRKYKQELRLP